MRRVSNTEKLQHSALSGSFRNSCTVLCDQGLLALAVRFCSNREGEKALVALRVFVLVAKLLFASANKLLWDTNLSVIVRRGTARNVSRSSRSAAFSIPLSTLINLR